MFMLSCGGMDAGVGIISGWLGACHVPACVVARYADRDPDLARYPSNLDHAAQ